MHVVWSASVLLDKTRDRIREDIFSAKVDGVGRSLELLSLFDARTSYRNRSAIPFGNFGATCGLDRCNGIRLFIFLYFLSGYRAPVPPIFKAD
jgi:hypothetical protein